MARLRHGIWNLRALGPVPEARLSGRIRPPLEECDEDALTVENAELPCAVVGVVQLAVRVNQAFVVRILVVEGIHTADPNPAARPLHEPPLRATREVQLDVTPVEDGKTWLFVTTNKAKSARVETHGVGHVEREQDRNHRVHG